MARRQSPCVLVGRVLRIEFLTLKGGAAHKVLGKLLTEGLVEEVPARDSLPVWRRDEENRALALRITQHGLDAIQVEESGSQADLP